MSVEPLLEVTGIKKQYGGVQALDGVDLALQPGQVHALLGENGAGKSTLMRILAGAETADAGTLRIRGHVTRFRSVHDARRSGVGIVFQELALFPDLDVLTNLFSPDLPRNRIGFVDRVSMERRARDVLDTVGLDAPGATPLHALRLGDRQLVEIARALLQKSDVLILDEPNSALNATETERLLEIVRRLRDRGVGVIYISHRLEEVFRIADHVTVLRNGRVAASYPAAKTSIPEVVRAMIGREPTQPAMTTFGSSGAAGRPLRLQSVTVPGRLHDVSLALHPGEVVGLAGLEGSGTQAVFEVAFGRTPPESGEVILPDGRRGPRSVSAAVRAGIAHVPSDRRRVGAMLQQSVRDNLAHVSAGVLGRHGWWLRRGQICERAASRVETMNVRTESLSTPVGLLSGGNQQKVVIGKWLEAQPDIILLNDPTRGVDVGSKAEIYDLIRAVAADDRVVLFTSSELMEYALVCDRVVVMHRGRVSGEIAGTQATEHRLLEAINTGAVHPNPDGANA